MISSCLQCGGEYRQRIGQSLYTITLRQVNVTMTGDELAHMVVTYISWEFHWHNDTTVDWYAYAGDTESQSDEGVRVRRSAADTEDDVRIQVRCSHLLAVVSSLCKS